MGRTVASYRTVLEALISDWQNFRKALRKEDQVAFDQLMNKARGLASAAGYDPRLDPMESVFMSILVELENAQHCVIKGNLVYDNQVAEHGEGGITLHSGVDYCILEGNKCFDTQDPKTQKYGIDIVNANCDDNVILGNDVRGNLTAGIHDAGTGTIIRSNIGYNPVGISSISVGPSPFTHTAGASPETVYVSGGTITSITKDANNFGLTSGVFELEPHESIVVTYSVAPTMFKDVH